MTEEPLDPVLREALEEWTPPPTPREAIWRGIAERRAAAGGLRSGHLRTDEARSHDRHVSGTARPGVPRRRAWRLLPLAAAAALLLTGVWLGRWSAPHSAPEPNPAPVAATASPKPDVAYRLAAAGYLGRTETLLTRFRADKANDADLAPRARELVGELRLFLDSPAARDPELRRLLLDLEVLLVRIVHAGDLAGERGDITRSLEERSIMMRIRNRLPAGI